MNKFKITSDLTPRSEKPSSNEIGYISNNLNNIVEVSIEEFSNMMQLGYTWSAGIFNGTRKNINWIEQSIFALDFDNGVTPEEIINRFKTLSIIPNVIYTSFSDIPEHRKFRIVIFIDKIIINIDERNFIQKGLMSMIGDVDIACKDAARLYFGGKQSTVINPDPINVEYLVDCINCAIIASDSGKTRKLTKNISSTNSTNNNKETEKLYTYTSKIEHFDFNKLRKEVIIFDKFMSGEWLEHPQIFGLATALIWIEGGIKLMKDTMNKFNKEGNTHYTPNNFAALTYVKYKNYQPQKLKNYSPYEDDWAHLNPITAVKEVRGMVEIINPIEKIPMKDAEELMEKRFHDILNEDSTNIFIMKLPTGIGKTKLLENVTATLALPTNALKEEVFERVAVRKTMTPTLPELKCADLQRKIQYLYSVGLNEVAVKLIHSISKNNQHKYEEDIVALKKYIKDLRTAYAANRTAVVTTHTRAIYSNFQSDTIIFDEDPIQTLLPIKSFNISDFIKLEGIFSENIEIPAVIDYLRSVPKGQCITTPQFSFDIRKFIDKISKNNMLTDIISFVQSDYFIRDIINPNIYNYITKSDFPKKKIIVMSATISSSIYTALYGDRVKIVDFSDVKHAGSIIQNTSKSFSRESLRLSIDKIDRIINTDLPSITFKEFVNKIENGVKEMYFGNVSGYDTLKGKDINVIGTPHLHNSVYLLIANSIGLKLKPSDLIMEYIAIEWNGFKFKFNCYVNEALRDIQLSMIESQLIQAVGRARALREECNVYVYSNLPLRVSTEIISKKYTK